MLNEVEVNVILAMNKKNSSIFTKISCCPIVVCYSLSMSLSILLNFFRIFNIVVFFILHYPLT